MINQALAHSEFFNIQPNTLSLSYLRHFTHIVEHTLLNAEEEINLQIRAEQEIVQQAFDDIIIKLQTIVP